MFFDSKRFSKISLYTSKQALYYLKEGFKGNLIKGFSRNGYCSMDTLKNYKNISEDSGKERTYYHGTIFNSHRVAQNIEYLELLLKELKKNDIIPILLTPPVFSTYSNNVDSKIMTINKGSINYLVSKYHCEYYDYFTDTRFVRRDFYDNDHLNFIGAEKFSEIINFEILGNKDIVINRQD